MFNYMVSELGIASQLTLGAYPVYCTESSNGGPERPGAYIITK